ALVERLNREVVAIAVDDERRELIGFGVDKTIHMPHSVADRGGQPLLEERRVDRLDAPRQQAQADLRRGTVVRNAQRATLGIEHWPGSARGGRAAIYYVAREDPGMSGSDTVRALAVNPYAGQRVRIAWSRAMRSAVDGCVEKSFMTKSPPLKGL